MSIATSNFSLVELSARSTGRRQPHGQGITFRSLPYEIKKMILEMHLYRQRVIHVRAKFWNNTSKRTKRDMDKTRYLIELQINLGKPSMQYVTLVEYLLTTVTQLR
jgi:hypothetical protein